MSHWNRRTFLTRGSRSALSLGIGLTSSLLWAISAGSAEPPWQDVYRDGFQISHLMEGWQSSLTSSARTPDGLQITDPSTAKGSGRFFQVDWGVEPPTRRDGRGPAEGDLVFRAMGRRAPGVGWRT